MTDEPESWEGWRAYRIAEPADPLIGVPLGSPFQFGDPLPYNGVHTARCRDHQPPYPAHCGIVTAATPGPIAEHLRWAGPGAEPYARQARIVRYGQAWLDTMALARVDAYPPLVPGTERDLELSPCVRLAEVWIPAAAERHAGRITDVYGVDVHVGQHSGVEWLDEAFGDYDAIGIECIACGAPAVEGVCQRHFTSPEAGY